MKKQPNTPDLKKLAREHRQELVKQSWKQQKQLPTVKSSTAEFLIFNASLGDDPAAIEIRYEDENIWLTQKLMAELFDVEVNTINYHVKQIFEEGELSENSVIRKFRITASDGKNYNTNHYSLQMIFAVGFRVNSQRATHFRKWVGQIAKDYTIQGWVMDVPRLKHGANLTDEFWERQLAIIREIRLSERKFYQKITDIYATALDYDKEAKITRDFFATVQNKLHFAIHGQTAAEVIVDRANADKTHMGLTFWEAAPDGKIQKPDVVIAKNYLTDSEIGELERVVSAYLDIAENYAMRKIPLTMEDWDTYLTNFLKNINEKGLSGKGCISAEQAKQHAESEFEKYRIVQDRLYESDFDRFFKLENEVKQLKEKAND